MKKFLILLGSAVLFACSAKDVVYNYPDNPDYARKNRAGSLSSKKDLVIFNASSKEQNSAELSQNSLEESPLWHAAVEVANSLIPVTLADADGGMIVTAWQNDAAETRHKINIVVRGSTAKKENLQVLIFYQKKKNSTEWEIFKQEDSTQENSDATRIMEKILEKARL